MLFILAAKRIDYGRQNQAGTEYCRACFLLCKQEMTCFNNKGMDKNKYCIASTPLQHWDYGWSAAYFVTICTQNRLCWFGEIVDVMMDLSFAGHIANYCWYEIPNHFPLVELGEHVIMPNHVHGIVIINKPDNERNVERKNQFGPQSKNMASIIRGFKIWDNQKRPINSG